MDINIKKSTAGTRLDTFKQGDVVAIKGFAYIVTEVTNDDGYIVCVSLREGYVEAHSPYEIVTKLDATINILNGEESLYHEEGDLL